MRPQQLVDKLLDLIERQLRGSVRIEHRRVVHRLAAPGARQPSTVSPCTLTIIPTVTIGGAPAQVMFSGLAPGFVGLYQVNVQVPAGLAATNAAPVVISGAGVTSNTVTMALQ